MLRHNGEVDHLEKRPHCAIRCIPLAAKSKQCGETRIQEGVENKRKAYVGTNLCFTSSLHSSMVEPLNRPTP